MHNLLLGTAKSMVAIWKEKDILNNKKFELIHFRINKMQMPPLIGRIPSKICTYFNSFTADQWQNWTCIYSPFALYEVLPNSHYDSWMFFVRACQLLLQPCVAKEDLETADIFLSDFVIRFSCFMGERNAHLIYIYTYIYVVQLLIMDQYIFNLELHF